MFKVFLIKVVWNDECIDSSSVWASLHREVALPFAPFVGLDINFPMERAWRLRSVSWDLEAQAFHCHVEDQFIDLFDESDFDEWIESLVETGWHLVGKYPNDFSEVEKLRMADAIGKR